MDTSSKHIQLDIFGYQQAASSAGGRKIVRTVSTDLGRFGNRTDIFELGDVVRGASLLECDDEDVRYFNQHSQSPKEALL